MKRQHCAVSNYSKFIVFMQIKDEIDSFKANQSVFSLLLWGLYVVCSKVLCTSKAGRQLVDLKQPYAPLATMSVHYGGFFTTKPP